MSSPASLDSVLELVVAAVAMKSKWTGLVFLWAALLLGITVC